MKLYLLYNCGAKLEWYVCINVRRMTGKVKGKYKLQRSLLIRVYKLIKLLKWVRINVSKRVLERNFLIDLGILAYGFIKERLDNIMHSIPYFFAFLALCLVVVLLFALIERVMLGLYKNIWWGINMDSSDKDLFNEIDRIFKDHQRGSPKNQLMDWIGNSDI